MTDCRELTFEEAKRHYREDRRRIRHDAMPEGVWIEPYKRPWGRYDMIVTNEQGHLYGGDEEVDFLALFYSALHEDDTGWEAAPCKEGV